MANRRSTSTTFLEGFTLSPLPYPVLGILGAISIFLGISTYFSYESVVETAEEQMGWILFATPVVLIFIVRWLSSTESSSDWIWEKRRSWAHQHLPNTSEGSSPWGVAAFILLLLILVQYQSIFLHSWFG